MSYIVVPPKGDIIAKDEGGISIDLLRREMGVRYVEYLPKPERHGHLTFWASEEPNAPDGTALPQNPRATALLSEALWPGTRIVGTVVVTGLPDGEGDIMGLDPEQEQDLLKSLGR
jgi:hypothetical protein